MKLLAEAPGLAVGRKGQMLTPATAREIAERKSCPACCEGRCHTDAEWGNHPRAGHGFTGDTGQTFREKGK